MENAAPAQSIHAEQGAFPQPRSYASPGSEEESARSHFEAFHRDTRFDYPPQKSGARQIMAGIAGMFGLVFFALAFAAWMDPALVPQGAKLLNTAGAAIGLERPARPREESIGEFGISRGELPYDGKAVPDAAGTPAKPPEPPSSSGSSNAQQDDAGQAAPATEAVSASVSAADVAKTEETAPTPTSAPTIAPAPEKKPTPSVKPHPKQTASASSTRKKEISRLRRQAEEEMYAE